MKKPSKPKLDPPLRVALAKSRPAHSNTSCVASYVASPLYVISYLVRLSVTAPYYQITQLLLLLSTFEHRTSTSHSHTSNRIMMLEKRCCTDGIMALATCRHLLYLDASISSGGMVEFAVPSRARDRERSLTARRRLETGNPSERERSRATK